MLWVRMLLGGLLVLLALAKGLPALCCLSCCFSWDCETSVTVVALSSECPSPLLKLLTLTGLGFLRNLMPPKVRKGAEEGFIDGMVTGSSGAVAGAALWGTPCSGSLSAPRPVAVGGRATSLALACERTRKASIWRRRFSFSASLTESLCTGCTVEED